jgi:hypothetical protein
VRGSVGATFQLGATFGVVILAGPHHAAHVSTEAFPRGLARSLRSSNQLMAPMAPTASNSRMPASLQNADEDLDGESRQEREDRAKHSSRDNRPDGPGWETAHVGPAR